MINLAVRLAAFGACLALLAALLSGRARRAIKLALGGLLIGTMAYLIHSEPAFALPRPAMIATDLASLFTPYWSWLFARHLFEREPKRVVAFAVAAFLVACWAVAYFAAPGWLIGFYGIHLGSLALMADLLRNAWLGREDDLIEKRRMIRIFLPVAIALEAAGVMTIELANGMAKPPQLVQCANALLILCLTLFAAMVLLRADDELLAETGAADQPPARRPEGEPTPQERVLLERLEAAMLAGHYRTPGLTITGLAAHLGAPEHRLRALINRRLGYRNFSAYLNTHRIAQAKSILANKEQVDLPVLTIAMDLGYNSLPTFNRAFRETAGCTPTTYRRQAIGQD